MALIPGYEHDVFISYVHADNESETDDTDGWINQFYKYLDTKLKKHSADINIWWDAKNLDRSEVFDNSIMEAIDKSAIMICVYSRRYPQSEYCQKELEHFYKKIEAEKAGTTVGNRSRIIPVLISNIHFNDWDERLKGTTGFEFHDAIDKDDYGDALDVSTAKFKDQMKQLRNALVHIFEDFPTGEKSANEAPSNTPSKNSNSDDAFTIYLGEVNDSMEDRRDGIVSELKNQGYNVLTGDPCISEATVHQKITKEAIEKSNMAVHLFGEFPGKKINGDPDRRYIQTQAEIGFETMTPQLMWIPAQLEISQIVNEGHKTFLQNLEEGTATPKNIEFIRGNEGELAKIILDQAKHLKEVLRKENSEKQSEHKEQMKVLLDTHIDDFKQAFLLRENLLDHDIKLIFNPEDGDPQKNIELLYENISEAKKFIFLYGKEENNDWVDIRVKNTMKKLMEYDRYDQEIFIYMSPPDKEPNSLKIAQSPLVKVIDNSGEQIISDQCLDELLNDLREESK